MSKISCDVTRDLLASYLDGICSEESRGLVEEHLQECAVCKQFVEQIREKDLGKDAVKMDFFKRMRRSMSIRAWLGVALALAMVFVAHPKILSQPLDLLFYYIAMPILMPVSAIVSADGSKESLPSKWERLLPLLGFALVCAALILQVMSLGIFSEKIAPPRPMVEMGAWLDLRYTCVAVLSVILLILSILRLKGRKSVFIVSQNIAWLGMNLALSCDTLIYHMADFSTINILFWTNFIILVMEFVVMTALMLAFYHIFERLRAYRIRR